MDVHIVTYGCKVNFCESESILQLFLNHGYSLSSNLETADIVIVNSCCVTKEAVRKCCRFLRKIRKINTECVLALTGCIPQILNKDNSILKDIDIIIGNKNKMDIVDEVLRFIQSRSKMFKVDIFDNKDIFNGLPVYKSRSRVRSFLKIQDGCDCFCSYCIIPYTRGKSRSKSLKSILADSNSFATFGFREIVLVGINLSNYGYDISSNLCEAIEIVNSVDKISRIRLSSIDPYIFFNKDIIERLSGISKLCPHFHISLQSGSDAILTSMNRHYTAEQYLKVVHAIKSKIKNATITTDVMVGFPGETEEDFKNTMDVILKAEFLKVHVFPYSIRPGTKAAVMTNQVSRDVKSDRVRKIIKLSENTRKSVIKRCIGKVYNVLYEQKIRNNIYGGYTENYIYIISESNVDIVGQILKTELISIENDVAKGRLYE